MNDTFHVEKGRITAKTINHIAVLSRRFQVKELPFMKSLRGQDKGRG